MQMREFKRARWTGLRLALTALIVGAIALFAVACGSDDSDSGSSSSTGAQSQTPSGDPIPLRMGYVPVADPLMLELVSNGSLERNGLDASVVKFLSGIPQIAALSKGDIDVGYMAAPPLISMGSQGIGVKAIALSDWNGPANGLVVPADSDIRSIADLRGKTVATLVGSILEFALNEMLKTEGLTTRDVRLVNIQTQLTPAIFRAGDVDAVYTNQVPMVQLEAAGARVVAREDTIPSAGIAGLTYFVANSDYLSENPEAAKRFLAAVQETVESLEAKPELGVARFERTFGLSEADARTLQSRITVIPLARQLDPDYEFNLDGGVQRAMVPVVDFMAGLGQIKGPIDPAKVIDAQYVRAAVDGD
jgi:sulfonate transport system substrate-binding protein